MTRKRVAMAVGPVLWWPAFPFARSVERSAATVQRTVSKRSARRERKMTTVLQCLQEMVLDAEAELGPWCRIAGVRAHVEDRLDAGRAFGALFTTLDRLEAKGFVTWRLGPPSPVRGGRAPRLYALTEGGRAALRLAKGL